LSRACNVLSKLLKYAHARVAELVDALVLGTSALGRESSSLSPSTNNIYMPKKSHSKSKVSSPRVAHVDFQIEKEHLFINYVKYLSSPVHIMWRNFLAGAFRGLGFVLGSAILLWLIGVILDVFPFFSDLTDAVNIWLDSFLEK
jgi:hypothetical protein